MTPDLARAALVFLSRADLKGGEAPVLMQIVAVLEAVVNAPVPAGEPEAAPPQ